MLPETGSISMSQVNVELKKGETSVITLNDTDVRKLAGKPSGIISMEDLRGKKASEYVENYQLFNKYIGGSNGGGRTYDYSMNIPHKILSGKLIITMTTDCVDKKRPNIRTPYVSIQNIGTVNAILETKTSYFDIQSLNIDNIPISIFTGCRGNESVKNSYSVDVTIKFTGEWEA